METLQNTINIMAQLDDAEKAIDACKAALTLVPVWALEKEINWHPSREAVLLIQEAKEALDKYSRKYSVVESDDT